MAKEKKRKQNWVNYYYGALIGLGWCSQSTLSWFCLTQKDGTGTERDGERQCINLETGLKIQQKATYKYILGPNKTQQTIKDALLGRRSSHNNTGDR